MSCISKIKLSRRFDKYSYLSFISLRIEVISPVFFEVDISKVSHLAELLSILGINAIISLFAYALVSLYINSNWLRILVLNPSKADFKAKIC